MTSSIREPVSTSAVEMIVSDPPSSMFLAAPKNRFGPLVDEQDDEVDLGMVVRDAVGDVLQQHRLAGPGRRDDETALTLADRHHHVEHARREVLAVGFERNLLLRVERRQIFEEHL